MGETVLVRADLTPRMVDAGRELVIGLDTRGLGFEAAFWLMDEDNGRWHLVLSSRAVKFDGSRAQYAAIHKVLLSLRLQNDIWIGMISIVGHRTPLIRSLREALGPAAAVDGVRLDNAFIDGVSLPGCMLYRLSARQKLQPMGSEGSKR